MSLQSRYWLLMKPLVMDTLDMSRSQAVVRQGGVQWQNGWHPRRMEVRMLVVDRREAVCDISTVGPTSVVAGRAGPIAVSCVITSAIEVGPHRRRSIHSDHSISARHRSNK